MNSGPQLAVGARGQDVQRVQTIFVMMKTFGFDQIDGVFGTLTRSAVVAFQESEGLPADGVVGDSTWQRMPADPDTPILKRGSTGNAVAGLQKGLRKFGGPGSPTDAGPADGDFGAAHRSCGQGLSGAARAGDRRRGRPSYVVGTCGRCRRDPRVARRTDDGVARN